MNRLLLALITFVLAHPLPAQMSEPGTTAVNTETVIYIDLDPTRASSAMVGLQHIAQLDAKQAGCLAVALIRENGRPNHVLLIESWRSLGDLNRWRSSPSFKNFRGELQASLASPFDERTGNVIGP